MAKDDITLELEQLASTSDVEEELARMKAAVGPGPSGAAQAIEGQQAPSQSLPPTTPSHGSYPAPPAFNAEQPQQAPANEGDLR
jgi:phage shock protein A